MRWASMLLVLGSCAVEAREAPTLLHREPFAALRGDGLSGGTADDDGAMWAIAEERRELHRFDGSWTPSSHVRIPLLGVEPGLELESAAWLGRSLIALGTERDEPGDDDDVVLVARVDGSSATVVGSWAVPFRTMLGGGGAPNQGVEGLCAAGETVLAAGEWVEDGPLGRLAPLARTNHHDGVPGGWQPLRLRLTSATGKVSALDCAEAPGGALLVHAIERHFGVTRVLRFVLDGATEDVVEPTVVADLAATTPSLPNVEVLVLGTDRFWMVSDHDVDDVDGTTEILHLGDAMARVPLGR